MRYTGIDRSEHPAKRERPHDITTLFVHKPEWPDVKAMCAAYREAEIVGVKKVPLIPAFQVEVLCADQDTKLALAMAWQDYSETSPHRPHGEEEALAWGKQFSPVKDIPSDWTF